MLAMLPACSAHPVCFKQVCLFQQLGGCSSGAMQVLYQEGRYWGLDLTHLIFLLGRQEGEKVEPGGPFLTTCGIKPTEQLLLATLLLWSLTASVLPGGKDGLLPLPDFLPIQFQRARIGSAADWKGSMGCRLEQVRCPYRAPLISLPVPSNSVL